MSNHHLDPDADMTGGSGLGLGLDVMSGNEVVGAQHEAVEPPIESSIEDGPTEPPKEPEFDEKFYNEMVSYCTLLHPSLLLPVTLT